MDVTILYYIISILCNIVNTYIIYKFYHYILKKEKTSAKTQFLTFGLYFLVNTVCFAVIRIPVITVLCTMTGYYLLTYNYESTQKQRIVTAVSILVIAALVETLIVYITTQMQFNVLGQNNYEESAGQIFITIFYFLTVEIIGRKFQSNNSIKIPKSYWLEILITPIFSYGVMLCLILLNPEDKTVISICCLLLLAINIAMFFLYDRLLDDWEHQIEARVLEQQNLYYSTQLKNFETSNAAARKLRHDQNNLILTMKTYIDHGEYDKLKCYFHDLEHRTLPGQNQIRSGNSVIDSIVNYKMREAENAGITVDFQVDIRESINISDVSLTIILGNLLDNAIEAAASVKENPTIHFSCFTDIGLLHIAIANPYRGVRKQKNGTYLTTKENPAGHGLGLKSVKEEVKKNNGMISVTDEENRFVVSVILTANPNDPAKTAIS